MIVVHDVEGCDVPKAQLIKDKDGKVVDLSLLPHTKDPEILEIMDALHACKTIPFYRSSPLSCIQQLSVIIGGRQEYPTIGARYRVIMPPYHTPDMPPCHHTIPPIS